MMDTALFVLKYMDISLDFSLYCSLFWNVIYYSGRVAEL